MATSSVSCLEINPSGCKNIPQLKISTTWSISTEHLFGEEHGLERANFASHTLWRRSSVCLAQNYSAPGLDQVSILTSCFFLWHILQETSAPCHHLWCNDLHWDETAGILFSGTILFDHMKIWSYENNRSVKGGVMEDKVLVSASDSWIGGNSCVKMVVIGGGYREAMGGGAVWWTTWQHCTLYKLKTMGESGGDTKCEIKLQIGAIV